MKKHYPAAHGHKKSVKVNPPCHHDSVILELIKRVENLEAMTATRTPKEQTK